MTLSFGGTCGRSGCFTGVSEDGGRCVGLSVIFVSGGVGDGEVIVPAETIDGL